MWIVKYMIPESKFFIDDHEKASIVKDDNGNNLTFESEIDACNKADQLQRIENEKPIHEPRNVYFHIRSN